MSTTVRILILVGILVVSIGSYFICIRLAKKIDDKNTNDKTVMNIPNIFYGIALIIALVLLFSYPNRVFLTIEKIAWISIGLSIINISVTATLIIEYVKYIKHKLLRIVILPVAIIIYVGILIGGMVLFINSPEKIEETDKTVVSEKIEPFISAQAKSIFVEYDENNNVVSCKYYYIEDNNLEDNEIIGAEIKDVVYIDDIEDSYIEKTETSINYINHEMKPSSDEYSYTKIEESYVLFLNKDQIVDN